MGVLSESAQKVLNFLRSQNRKKSQLFKKNEKKWSILRLYLLPFLGGGGFEPKTHFLSKSAFFELEKKGQNVYDFEQAEPNQLLAKSGSEPNFRPIRGNRGKPHFSEESSISTPNLGFPGLEL